MNSLTSQPPSHLPPQEMIKAHSTGNHDGQGVNSHRFRQASRLSQKPNLWASLNLLENLWNFANRKLSLSSPLRPSNLDSPASALLQSCAAFLLAFVILHSSFVIAAPPPELTVLRQQYDKIVAERVTAPFDASLAELNTKFTTALTNTVTTAKQAGKLDDVLAIQDDQKRLAEKLPIPDDSDTTPEALKKLRAIYRGQLAKLEEARTANHAALLPAYTAKLQTLEVTLTKADRIEEAKEIKTYREGLVAGVADKAMAANESKPPESPTPGVATVAPAGKGDDRAAAELILSIGGSVALSGKPDLISSVDALPKGHFAIRQIKFSQSDKLKRKLEAADADKLANLEQLDYFLVNNTITDDETLRFLASCPKLQFIHVENCGWLTGSWLQYAAPLKELTSLTVVEGATNDTSAIGNFQSSGLTSIHMRNTATDDQTLLAISRFKKLRAARLRMTRITDAGVSHLAALKDLVTFDVCETPVSIEGMKVLAGAQLTELGFGMTPEDMATAVQELAVMFPKVVDFQYPPRGTTTAAHLAALGKAWPKLKRLEFASNHKFEPDAFISAGPLFPAMEHVYLWKGVITDEHLRGIAQMKKLGFLDIVDSKVTDACLPDLEKMKALKKLFVRGTKISDVGIAALKKKRPDIQISY